jgi:hypothetical protein
MPALYAYRKVTDAITTHTLRAPFDGSKQTSQELCTLADGRTVVVLLGDYTLPANQPAAIAASIQPLPTPLPDDLRDEIIAASPAMQLIARRLQEHIRAKYSADDELYFSRINLGQLSGMYTMTTKEIALTQAFAARAEEARALAKIERAKLGI